MFRRLLVLCLALAALMGPASPTNAAVAGYTTGVTKPKCTHTGGKHDQGFVKATATFAESGGTGTNYFKSIAWVQRWTGSAWVRENKKASLTSNSFPDSHNGYTWKVTWTYAFTPTEVGKTFRAYFVYEFWDKTSNPDHRLASFNRTGPSCTA